MAGAVANMISPGRVSLRTAVTMASATPAAFPGLADRTGTIAAGCAADLALAGDALKVERTRDAGQRNLGWNLKPPRHHAGTQTERDREQPNTDKPRAGVSRRKRRT